MIDHICARCHAKLGLKHDDDCAPLEPETLRIPRAASLWIHYKGGLYRIVGVSVLERDLQVLVNYRKEGRHFRVWSRPLAEFLERFRPQ